MECRLLCCRRSRSRDWLHLQKLEVKYIHKKYGNKFWSGQLVVRHLLFLVSQLQKDQWLYLPYRIRKFVPNLLVGSAQKNYDQFYLTVSCHFDYDLEGRPILHLHVVPLTPDDLEAILHDLERGPVSGSAEWEVNTYGGRSGTQGQIQVWNEKKCLILFFAT